MCNLYNIQYQTRNCELCRIYIGLKSRLERTKSQSQTVKSTNAATQTHLRDWKWPRLTVPTVGIRLLGLRCPSDHSWLFVIWCSYVGTRTKSNIARYCRYIGLWKFVCRRSMDKAGKFVSKNSPSSIMSLSTRDLAYFHTSRSLSESRVIREIILSAGVDWQ